MESSTIVGKTTSQDNPDEVKNLYLDVVQCNAENIKGRDSLSVNKVKKIKIKENDRPPKIEGISSNKIGKKDRDWIRVKTVETEDSRKNKVIGTVKSWYSKKALDRKLEIVKAKALRAKGGKEKA